MLRNRDGNPRGLTPTPPFHVTMILSKVLTAIEREKEAARKTPFRSCPLVVPMGLMGRRDVGFFPAVPPC